MPSGAGHDAQAIAQLGPMGMIFIPSVGGISHSPKEFSHAADIANGANVLLGAVIAADSPSQPQGKRNAGRRVRGTRPYLAFMIRLHLVDGARHGRREVREAGVGEQERVLDADADLGVLLHRRQHGRLEGAVLGRVGQFVERLRPDVEAGLDDEGHARRERDAA